MTSTHLIKLTQKDALEIWPSIAPEFESALYFNGGEENIQDLYKRLKQNKFLVWIVVSSDQEVLTTFTTVCVEYSKQRVVRVSDFGGSKGSVELIQYHLEDIEHWAKHVENADGLEIVGREAWKKVMKPFGFKPKYVKLFKEL